MSEAHFLSATGPTRRGGASAAIARTIARGLCLAATPAFAGMALLASVAEGRATETLCSVRSMSPLSGMVAMYLLMSVLHSPPWLKLMSGR